MIYLSVEFEFDPKKSAANKVKHGINFDEAQELWNGFTVEFPSRQPGEKRMLVLGVVGEKHWTAIITHRDDAIRIISVRRSRDDEKLAYQTYKTKNNG